MDGYAKKKRARPQRVVQYNYLATMYPKANFQSLHVEI